MYLFYTKGGSDVRALDIIYYTGYNDVFITYIYA